MRRLLPSKEKTPPMKENEFFPAPGGRAGSVNYQAPLNTHNSPNVAQDPSKFVDPNANKAMGSTSNTAGDVPASPVDIKKAVDRVYAKKTVPTADQVKAGLDYELSQMIKPDKAEAKARVMQRLAKDPNFYGSLHMLNIDDKNMDVDLKESKMKSVNIKETVKIFTELAQKREKKYDVNQGIVDIMRGLQEQRKKSQEVLKSAKNVK